MDDHDKHPLCHLHLVIFLHVVLFFTTTKHHIRSVLALSIWWWYGRSYAKTHKGVHTSACWISHVIQESFSFILISLYLMFSFTLFFSVAVSEAFRFVCKEMNREQMTIETTMLCVYIPK